MNPPFLSFASVLALSLVSALPLHSAPQPTPEAVSDIGAAGPAQAAAPGEANPDLLAKTLPLLKRPADPADAGKQADALLKLLTDEEKFQLICGTGMGTAAIPRLGIPSTRFTDASAGIRIDPKAKERLMEKSTAFPCTLLLTATWDPKLAAAYAHAIGEECRAADINVLLGPGVNIYRKSINGRNFEYMGEDPYLASRMVEAYVHGLQETGVMATVKHYMCNNTDFKRKSMNAIVDERALREIYTPAFQAAIDAGTWGVMTGYNQVNGEWMGQNKEMVAGFLRGQLGFKWLVMTDWVSTWDGGKILASGTDLDMPSGRALQPLKGKLQGNPDLDRMVHSILKAFIASGVYEAEAAKQFQNTALLAKFPEHVDVARKVNEEGIVLLKNNGLLPLAADAKGPILVCGNNAERRELSGGGSGHVAGYDLITYAEEAAKRLGSDRIIINATPTDEQLKAASSVLMFSGFNPSKERTEGEGSNRTFDLPDDALIARSVKLNPRTVVFLTSGGGVANDWADDAAAVVFGSYGGQTGAPAAFDILLGKTNPSGKLPFTWEKRFEDSVGFGEDRIPPNKTPYISPMFVGREGPFFFDKSTNAIFTYDVPYMDGIFVGYRWFDSKNIIPRFPFGHGLSYTTFGYRDLKVAKQNDGKVAVSFTLENTGKVAGAEVAQIYVGDPQCSVPRPPKELKGFQKILLAPGESKTVTVELGQDAFRFWDPASKKWTVEPGTFDISVGSSSRDIRLKGIVTL